MFQRLDSAVATPPYRPHQQSESRTPHEQAEFRTQDGTSRCTIAQFYQLKMLVLDHGLLVSQLSSSVLKLILHTPHLVPILVCELRLATRVAVHDLRAA